MEILSHNTTAWVAMSFVLLVALLVKVARSKINAVLDDKIAQIKAEIETAERLKAEAQALLADFQQKQREAEKAAEDIIEAGRKSAEGVFKMAESDLAESMERREAQLADRLKRIEEKAIADIQDHAADLAMQATREIVVKTLDEKTSGKLVDQAISSVAKYLN